MKKVDNFKYLQVEINTSRGMIRKEFPKQMNSVHKYFVTFFKFELIYI